MKKMTFSTDRSINFFHIIGDLSNYYCRIYQVAKSLFASIGIPQVDIAGRNVSQNKIKFSFPSKLEFLKSHKIKFIDFVFVILLLLSDPAFSSSVVIGPIDDSIDGAIGSPSTSMNDDYQIVAWTDSQNHCVLFSVTDESGQILYGPVQASPSEHLVSLSPSVAMDEMGSFVVAWTSGNQGTFGVYFQRYDVSGNPIGTFVRASPTDHGVTSPPSIAADGMGNFIIAWNPVNQGAFGAYFQRYDVNGNPIGTAVRASPTDHFVFSPPSVAADGMGNFIIAWNPTHLGAHNASFQRYNANGIPVGTVVRASPTDHIVFSPPSVAADGAGNFVVAWNNINNSFNPGDFGAYFQVYKKNGNPIGTVVRASPIDHFVAYNEVLAEEYGGVVPPIGVSMVSSGNLIVSWNEDTTSAAYARKFYLNGVALLEPFRVSPLGEHVSLFTSPVAASRITDSFSIAWISSSTYQVSHNLYLPDFDEDGIIDYEDNCPLTSNTDQSDLDGDGVGDACDTPPAGSMDADGDGIADNKDNCPADPNPDQSDVDGDGIGDVCDVPPPSESDADNDTVFDDADNCPLVANTDQADFDGDEIGDACDDDDDGDGVPDKRDRCPDTPLGTTINNKGCAI